MDSNKEFNIRISATADTEEIRNFIDYVRYKELASQGKKVDQSVLDKLTKEININWSNENKSQPIIIE